MYGIAPQIKHALRVFDTNGDGFISKEEFKGCMMHFTDEELPDWEVEQMLSEADLNNDGLIDYHEFSAMILKGMGREPEPEAEKQKRSRKKSKPLLSNKP